LALPALGALGFWLLMTSTNGYVPKTLSEVMVTSAHVHPKEATATVCAVNDCVEAWTTDVGTFMRYGSERKADYVTYVLGDQARRNGNIVVDFGTKEMSFQQRVDAVYLLFPGKDWY
jgi:hypothetical protein